MKKNDSVLTDSADLVHRQVCAVILFFLAQAQTMERLDRAIHCEATSQRPQWDTGTTVSPMAAIITSYRFSPHWVGMFAANYELYDKDIADSPLVQHNGELYGILAVGYSW